MELKITDGIIIRLGDDVEHINDAGETLIKGTAVYVDDRGVLVRDEHLNQWYSIVGLKTKLAYRRIRIVNKKKSPRPLPPLNPDFLVYIKPG